MQKLILKNASVNIVFTNTILVFYYVNMTILYTWLYTYFFKMYEGTVNCHILGIKIYIYIYI